MWLVVGLNGGEQPRYQMFFENTFIREASMNQPLKKWFFSPQKTTWHITTIDGHRDDRKKMEWIKGPRIQWPTINGSLGLFQPNKWSYGPLSLYSNWFSGAHLGSRWDAKLYRALGASLNHPKKVAKNCQKVLETFVSLSKACCVRNFCSILSGSNSLFFSTRSRTQPPEKPKDWEQHTTRLGGMCVFRRLVFEMRWFWAIF